MAITIEKNKIGIDHPPFVIAEMSGNHNQSLSRAIEIVERAAYSGVHALKLQTYTADTMTIDIKKGNFKIGDKNSIWYGENLYDLYKKAYTPWHWHKPIMKRARELGLVTFSTPFDESAVDFLETLEVPAYKIASFEITHLPLISKVAATGKPLIISTGMATISEIDNAVEVARTSGCKDLILLKCTSTYPASPENTNIKTIPSLRDFYNCEVGLSDHTLGVGVSVASVALGASVIEKHFTLDRADGGVDSAFSLEPEEMKLLVNETKRAWQSLGKVYFGPTKEENKSLIYRRSLYVSEAIEKGDVFSKDNLKIIRPGDGLPPKYLKKLIGLKSPKKIKKGTPLTFELLLESLLK